MILPINQPKWPITDNGCYEVWYFKLNLQPDPNGIAPALWIRLTTLATQDGHKRVCEVWGVFFNPANDGFHHVAAKNTFPLDQFKWDGSTIQFHTAFWSDHRTVGTVSSNPHTITWDLTFQPNTFHFDHIPAVFKALKLNKSTVVTPHPDIAFSGTITVDGKPYRCTNAPGMQGHIFGTQHATEWAWGHANMRTQDTHLVFEGLTARIKLAHTIPSPPLSAFFFVYNGECVIFNTLKDALRIRSTYGIDGWQFTARKKGWAFIGKIRTTPNEFAGVTYEDPAKNHLFCHNSKVSSLRLTIHKDGHHITTIDLPHRCAYEVVGPNHDTRIPILI